MIKEKKIRLPIKHLGSGVLQILYIISAIIYNKSKIVCVEELEQNLSPKLQNLALRKLQSMLGNEVDQIIMSSHSSVFAKPKLSDSIYLIEKEDSKTVIVEKIGNKFGNKSKGHFIHSAVAPNTYSKEEYKDYLDDYTKKMVENRFNA
jgi:predicted ATP-dependent endonuclease of OLD family